jgi:hypothetical protein
LTISGKFLVNSHTMSAIFILLVFSNTQLLL